MKQIHNIYHDNDHRWAVIMRDPERAPYMIDTNECLVVSGNEAILTDPGGMEIFPSVFSAISSTYNPRDIKAIFSSHQDPDIISSLTLWLEVNPELRCYISWLWSTFVPHFGGTDKTFIPIPDEGMTIKVGSIKLQCIPAHYLHSPGNFHLYDSRAKVYFSGDVGAAIIDCKTDIYVKNFDEHIKFAKNFHQRWMGSNEARLDWCERVSQLEIDMLVPQHGCIYQGKDVKRFIDWFSQLQVSIYAMAAELKIEESTGGFQVIPEPTEEEPVLIHEPELEKNPENENPDQSTITDDSDLKALIAQGSSSSKGEISFDGESISKPVRKSIFSAIKEFFKPKR